MSQNDDLDRQQKLRELRRIRRARKRRKALIIRTCVFCVLLAILIVCILAITGVIGKKGSGKTYSTATVSTVSGTDNSGADVSGGTVSGSTASSAESGTTESTAPAGSKEEALTQAEALAATYDYDGAIAKLQSFAGYETDADIQSAISTYTGQKNACTPVDLTDVQHIFFHSLMNDSRGLLVSDTCTEARVKANNAAMCTVGEFNNVIQDMYDAGYVMISLDDMIIKNDDGTVTKNTNILMPSGKHAFILSEDDLSYYHSYGENGAQGYADKLVIDDSGLVKCQYTDPTGKTLIGDYDMVPLIDTFIREHPDFVYHGARPTIALTGYNGIFGYRTNDYYKEGVNGADLGDAQKAWLANHPDYNYDEDVASATKIADALKAEGWTFASHTYHHWDVSTHSLDDLKQDNERWKATVGICVGDTDKLITAFGADIAGTEEYTTANEKYAYYKSEGYKIYCNCWGTWAWCQFGPDYLRTGRFAIDGFTLYQAITPDGNSYKNCSYNYGKLGVNNIADFFDPNRTTPIDGE
jgi:hypothetical protein